MTRQEAIRMLVNATYSDEWQGNEDLTTAIHMAIESLQEEPRPTGHWVDDGEMLWCSNCGNGWDAYFECHEVQLNDNGMVGWAMSYPAYCKYCGAKMEREK